MRIMGEIYQRAISCIVWLGEEENDSKLAMEADRLNRLRISPNVL